MTKISVALGKFTKCFHILHCIWYLKQHLEADGGYSIIYFAGEYDRVSERRVLLKAT